MKTNQPKILIVEDSENILEMLAMMFEFQEWQALKMKNLNDFLENVEKLSPDVILLDMLLSGKNGCDACVMLKADDKLKHIPVVMMSAHPTAYRDIENAGAEYFISKPFEIEELISVIEKALQH